ncbi:ParA family protein [Caldivirga sp. UBA161]|uniref:ParA family protein n=1 Tax=Caldivirga sp. UBA161 TaxID=1915569 RepID=UPI0025B9C1C1|nr:ParA family protein [Caldivirga sp. UBA161]
MPIIIPVISASGGVGKTTLTLLMAHYLVEYGENPGRILIVDTDPTAGLTLKIYGDNYDEVNNDRRTLYHMFKDYDKGKNIDIDDYVTTPSEYNDKYNSYVNTNTLLNVKVLPPGEDDEGDLSSLITQWLGEFGRGDALFNILNKSGALSRFNYIIIDTAPFFDKRYTSIALARTDLIKVNMAVIPLRPTLTDIKRTIRMNHTILRKINNEIKPIFTFNFDKDMLKSEAAALREAGIEVLAKGGGSSREIRGAKSLTEVVEAVNGLKSMGKVINVALAYMASLTRFPERELKGEEVYTPRCVISSILSEFTSIKPECDILTEEE